VVFESLQALGIEPDRISSHSYGEFPALVSAGAWSLDAAIRATHARCLAIKNCQRAQGGMLAAMAPAEVVERACEQLEPRVHVAGYNAPDQVVCGGPQLSLEGLLQRLEQEGYGARLVDAPCPAHTPLMSEIQEPMELALRELQIGPPHIPVLSSVTNRYVADPDEIKRNLVDQLTSPVRYVDQIERLYGEGVTFFVEVGPGQVLTLLHRRILNGRQATAIPTDYQKRDGLQQLLCVKACLEVAGAVE
jgi:acyl transferase domain-containing protein